jgi:hypothetical protein
MKLPLLLLLQNSFHRSYAIQQKYLIHHQELAVSESWQKRSNRQGNKIMLAYLRQRLINELSTHTY